MNTPFYNQNEPGSLKLTALQRKITQIAIYFFISFFVILKSNPVHASIPGSKAGLTTQKTEASSSLGDFLTYKGCALLASYAHPTNKFKYADWKIYDDRIWVDINYEDGYNTTLDISRAGALFTNIRVLYDNDFVTPFTFTQWIKDQIMKGLRNDRTSTSSSAGELSRYLQKTFEDMTGRDFTCVCFTAAWWDY